MATYELHGERASETGRSEYPHFTAAELAPRLIRFTDLKPCYNAFIDTRSPGSEAKENFTIIGPGVSENPNQHVHFAEPHSFNIGGARQPPGCVNSQHSHDTAEVFVVHSGQWRFDLGENGDDAQLYLSPGDVISLPTGTFRGFTNVGTAPGFLWAVLGGDNPGRVTWAPKVFDMAKDYGLVLLENGRLVDTAAGETVPDGAKPMPRTSEEQVAAMRRWTNEEAAGLVVRDRPGRDLTEIIAPGGPISWAHGFILSRIDLGAGEAWDSLATPSAHVLWCHRGQADISAKDGLIELAEGDTFSVPAGFNARITTTEGAVLFKVERFDDERLREAVPQPGRAQQTEDVRARANA